MQILGRRSSQRVAVGCTVVALLALVAAGAASATTVPNPCAILAKANPGHAFGHGKTLAVTHKSLKHYGSGKYASSYCSENVGTLQVSLSLAASGGGGFGGVKVTSDTHPGGFGGTANLIVGTSIKGTPVDFIEFHHGGVYADISANGAGPATLTTFGRLVYKAI